MGDKLAAVTQRGRRQGNPARQNLHVHRQELVDLVFSYLQFTDLENSPKAREGGMEPNTTRIRAKCVSPGLDNVGQTLGKEETVILHSQTVSAL